MYFKITKSKKGFVINDMTDIICFYCSSFLSLRHIVVQVIPNIITMDILHDYVTAATGYFCVFCGFLHGRSQNLGCLKNKNTQQYQAVTTNQLKQNVVEVTQFEQSDEFCCEEISCIGDFLYFCMRCLALISLPMRRASVCGFLHEANVAVNFSFSSLSLCDIVYWGKKNNTNVNKFFFFISKEDTVIRFVIAICHDPLEELLFFFFYSKT